MRQVHLDDRLYQEAKERADAAGYNSVDEFIARRLQNDFAQEPISFDEWFTPEVNAYLDRIASESEAGRSVSFHEMEALLDQARNEWRENPGSYLSGSLTTQSEVDAYVAFLLKGTRSLEATHPDGRRVPTNPDFQYVILRRNAQGQGHVLVYQVMRDVIYALDYFHTAQDWQFKVAEEPG